MSAVLTGYAYETIPGKSIIAGATKATEKLKQHLWTRNGTTTGIRVFRLSGCCVSTVRTDLPRGGTGTLVKSPRRGLFDITLQRNAPCSTRTHCRKRAPSDFSSSHCGSLLAEIIAHPRCRVSVLLSPPQRGRNTAAFHSSLEHGHREPSSKLCPRRHFGTRRNQSRVPDDRDKAEAGEN